MFAWIAQWLPTDPARLSTLEVGLAVLLAISGVAAAVFGLLLWTVTDYKAEIEKRLTEKSLTETRTALTDTRTELSDAQSRADEQLAQTRTELAEAQKRAAELEARYAPRRVSGSQRARILAELNGKPPSTVKIVYVWGDGEGERYAADFKSVFEAAGWTIPHLIRSTFSVSPIGLFVAVRDPNNSPTQANIATGAIDAAGIDIKGTRKNDVPDGEAQIIVGLKPQ